ncbi:MAG: hypothetical protein ABIT36_11345 [Steroidobacteraceae bacterium]
MNDPGLSIEQTNYHPFTPSPASPLEPKLVSVIEKLSRDERVQVATFYNGADYLHDLVKILAGGKP